MLEENFESIGLKIGEKEFSRLHITGLVDIAFLSCKKSNKKKKPQTNKELSIVCLVTIRYICLLEIYLYTKNNKIVHFYHFKT